MKKFTLVLFNFLAVASSFATGHFVPAFAGNGNDQMTINVVTANLGSSTLEAGDEIAVFDGAICCGVKILTQSISISDFATFVDIAASKADAGQANGYTSGHAILYRFWDSSKNTEISEITSEYLDPSSTPPITISAPTFNVGESAFVKLSGKVTVNQTPTANAGSDQSVNAGTIVSLDGSASSDPDNDALTYKWTAPEGITLSSNTIAKPTFTASEVTINTNYTFSLVVNDGTVNSAADQVIITVKSVNKIPIANAGPDQSVNAGTIVSLDGSASADPDNDVLTYLWSAPTAITLSSATVAKPTFTAPEVAINTNYTFSLVVRDGTSNSIADQVNVTIKHVNKIPIANAGPDQSVNEGTIVSLYGSASSDPDNEALTYKWTAPAGITLSSATVANPTFTAPEVAINTNYTFSLVVNDGTSNSIADQVIIVVKQVNKLPTSNAGADQSVNENTTVTLDGSDSTDPDGDALTYKWTAPTGITLSSTTVAKPTFTAPEVLSNTNYTFSLVVNDGKVDSPADQVMITVKNKDNFTQGHFVLAFTGNGQNQMNINVMKATIDGKDIEVGDEIASFDGSICCGVAILTESIVISDFNTFAAIAASQKDIGLTNGYTTGNAITYKFWDSSQNKEVSGITAEYYDVNTALPITAPTYTPGESAFVKLSTVVPVNRIPLSNAGPDQSVNEGTTTTLDGSASSDPDNNALTYLWTAPAGITLSSYTVAKPTFTAPKVTTNTNYTFTLVVNDGTVNSVADQVVVTVKQGNKAPIANAGADQSVNEGTTTTLDGSTSSDPDNDALTYLWTTPAGFTLSSYTVAKPTFTAPEVATNTNYTFTLVVNDGTVNSVADQVVVIINQVNKAPIANAGNDQSVNEGTTTTLDGSTSSDFDNDALTYLWTVPAGITLSSATVAKPTFTAPEVATNTNYTFTLVVNDGTVSSAADQVIITVRNGNKAPIANAGNDQSINEGVAVTLDGSASYDSDNDALTYLWTAPAGITLSSVTLAKPTFTAPEVATNTSYTFTLVVNDGTVSSATDQVIVTVNQVNKAPIANAGPDQSVNGGTIISLDGSASYDPDNEVLTYLWTAPAGITLSSATVAKPTFTAPDVALNTNYTFTLVVKDGTAYSIADQIIVTVKHVNKTPIANAGPDQSVNEETIVSLDGSASFDPDNDVLTYKWTAPEGIILSSTSVAKPTFTAPEVKINTNYTFSLVVNDGTVNSAANQVAVTVNRINNVPVANAGTDQLVDERTTVSLDGTVSSDPDNDALTYLWSAPAGIILSSATVAKPTFTAPEIVTNTNYTFSLVVNDGTVNSIVDQVMIIVKNVDRAPYVKDSIKNFAVYKSAPLQIIELNTVFADDDFGDILSYSIASNTNDNVTTAKITDNYLILSFSTKNTGTSEIVITASSNGKEARLRFKVEVMLPTSIDPLIEDTDVQIYPNPTKGNIHLRFNQTPKAGTLITVYSVTGNLISTTLADKKEEYMNLKGNSAGLYFIKIDQKISKTYKVVLE